MFIFILLFMELFVLAGSLLPFIVIVCVVL